MAECKLVIFDCDGTLMDTELIAASAETELLKEYGIEMSLEEFTLRFAGTSSQVVKDTMETEGGRHFPDDHFKRLANLMNEKLWREARATDHAQAMLDRLDQPRCICSNADMEKLKIELTRGELWDRFRPYIFSAKDIDGVSGKPAPDIFLHAAKEFEVEPADCIVVEDSVSGVEGGVAAGMRVIGFTGASHTHQAHADHLTEAGAITATRSLLDIPELVAALEQWSGAI